MYVFGYTCVKNGMGACVTDMREKSIGGCERVGKGVERAQEM